MSGDPQDERLVEEGSDEVEAHSAATEEVYPEPKTGEDEPDDSEPDFELHGSWGGIG